MTETKRVDKVLEVHCKFLIIQSTSLVAKFHRDTELFKGNIVGCDRVYYSLQKHRIEVKIRALCLLQIMLRRH